MVNIYQHGNNIGNQTIIENQFGASTSYQQLPSQLQAEIQSLSALIARQQNAVMTKEFEKFKQELSMPKANKSNVMSAWEAVKAAGSINGAHTLLSKISAGLTSYFML